jgi:hypothetical protein
MAITISQFITGFGVSISSLNVLFSSAVTAGNSIIVSHGNFRFATFTSITDPVNTAAYTERIHSTMSNASDTSAHLLIHDKLNISSGRAASTYRISVNYGGNSGISICAMEWSGGPLAFGSTLSANGTSTGPASGNLTASSTPSLFIGGAIVNSTAQFRSTVVGTGNWITTVDTGNTGQIMDVVSSTSLSSLTQNLTHAMTASTRWLASMVVYTGLGAGGATAQTFVDGFPMMGCV